MKKYLKKVRFKEIECDTFCNEKIEVDRTAKYEKYPLIYIEKDLPDFERDNKSIHYYEIGANVGMSVILAGKMLNNKGTVHSFEVEPANFKRLIDNIMLNNLDNTCGLPFGIGENCSLASFFINERHLIDDKPRTGEGIHSFHKFKEMNGWHSKNHSFKASIFPLDLIIKLFYLPIPTHVFIDAFGSELDILHGMKNILSNKSIQRLLVQIEDVGEYDLDENFDISTNKTYQFITSFGYKLIEMKPLPGIENFLRGYNTVFIPE